MSGEQKRRRRSWRRWLVATAVLLFGLYVYYSAYHSSVWRAMSVVPDSERRLMMYRYDPVYVPPWVTSHAGKTVAIVRGRNSHRGLSWLFWPAHVVDRRMRREFWQDTYAVVAREQIDALIGETQAGFRRPSSWDDTERSANAYWLTLPAPAR